MKHIPFSRDLCQKLLHEGYKNFVIFSSKGEFIQWHVEAILTLRPCADCEGKTLSIKQMMELSEDKLQNIYVVCPD